MTCAAHRPRHRRLWRMPSVRVAGTAGAGAIAAAAVSTAVSPVAPFAILAAGGAGVAAYLRRNRHRLAVEARMVRALRDSACRCPGAVDVPGLTGEVRATVTEDGVTRIAAGTWLDAVRALGYVTARDRGFQLDLLRRTAAGRLAEVWGPTMLPVDRRYRPLGLTPAAARAEAALDAPERDLLAAFADGVNAALRAHGAPFECRFLGYRPRPWAVADSLLVALYLLHGLAWPERAKRAEAVLRHALPADVAEFLLPGAGERAVPAGLADHRATTPAPAGLVTVDGVAPGSNGWVRTGPAGPVLAADPHLPLMMPNLLHETDLSWPGHRLRGLAVPGLPAVLVGGNDHLAWGVTNLTADVLDLVPAGDVVTATERIAVRGRPDALVDVVRDGVMPVPPDPLPGGRTALRWTGHDPRACDLRFHRLAHATSVADAVTLLDDAHGFPLNVLLADDRGHIAHLATGLLPRRPGDAHLAGPERPRFVDPPSGVLVSANDAALPEIPFRYGYDLDPGHRARRIREALADPATDARALQHDTAADLYLPYRDLAVRALTGRDDETAALLAAWDGHAATGSRAFGVLVRLRALLADRVLGPYLVACRAADPAFSYPFKAVDEPVLAIVATDDPALLPPGERDWSGLVARCVADARRDLGAATGRDTPAWGTLNAVGLDHPLTALAPWAGALLGVAPRAQPGAAHAVRTCVPGFGAVGRAVLTPGGHAAFDLPGGQSGHPLSPHYDDRHAGWSATVPTTTARPRRVCTYSLRPSSSGSDDR